MKKLMLGNEAIARGAYEAGVRVVSAYPGTPSTEVSECIAKYDEVYAEWAPNEKVAFEVAAGASYAGARSMVCMKHNGGLVILAADDPGMHSSQNEQDTRFYARSAHIPMLEPADSAEAKEFTKLAFELSEKYDTPVFVRTTTRLAHSQSFVEEEERADVPLRPYVKDVSKYTMMPSSAIGRHVAVEAREDRLAADVNGFDVNREEMRGTDLGIVCSGVVYQYVREAVPEASVLKLGIVYPLKRLVVVEELEPFIENQLKAHGVPCEGKDLFSKQGELSVAIIREKLTGVKTEVEKLDLPVRPPVMCAGCPHRGVFYILGKLKLTVNADIGCYTLGAQPPLAAVDTVLCMGASVGMAHGFEKARGREQSKKTVAVIGDSTFIHSGITGVINAVYNKSNITLIILDNSTTGMTGHQQHPATGFTLKQEPAKILDIVALCKTVGCDSVRVVDSYDLAEVEKAVKEEVERDGVSVIVAKRPCALLDRHYPPACTVEDCRKCGMCFRLGCPAIEKQADGSAKINASLCVGCGLCAKVCRFGAIKEGRK